MVAKSSKKVAVKIENVVAVRKQELAAVRNDPEWEPAEKLLERIIKERVRAEMEEKSAGRRRRAAVSAQEAQE